MATDTTQSQAAAMIGGAVLHSTKLTAKRDKRHSSWHHHMFVSTVLLRQRAIIRLWKSPKAQMTRSLPTFTQPEAVSRAWKMPQQVLSAGTADPRPAGC
jgi:hypothetical protein